MTNLTKEGREPVLRIQLRGTCPGHKSVSYDRFHCTIECNFLIEGRYCQATSQFQRRLWGRARPLRWPKCEFNKVLQKAVHVYGSIRPSRDCLYPLLAVIVQYAYVMKV